MKTIKLFYKINKQTSKEEKIKFSLFLTKLPFYTNRLILLFLYILLYITRIFRGSSSPEEKIRSLDRWPSKWMDRNHLARRPDKQDIGLDLA